MGLEKELKEARDKAEAADTAYEDVSKKLVQCDSDLEKAEERADVGETKILEQKQEQSLLINLSRNYRRKLTGLRMNLSLNRRSSKPSQKNWSKPLLRCLVIKHSKFVIVFHMSMS